MDKIEINIGLFGCVSVGKSTFLNAIAGQQYSDTEMKKTTMIPQVYMEKNNNESATKIIRENNREANEIIEKIIEQNQFTIDKCKPLYHQIDKICDLFDSNIIDTNLKINIYDIPGLNDSASKNIYFEWVRQNIKLFDIVIFMTDINQGLNNSDEIEILNLLMSFVIKNNIRMICLMNKCDDIYFDEKENDLIFEEKEQQNIYIQANNILADIAKNHGIEYDSEYFTPFYPISSENCFIYRALINNPEHKLDKVHINRLCKNECGVNQWKRMNNEQKESILKTILLDLNNTFESKIKDTGYLNIKDLIQRTIITNKTFFVQNKIDNNIKDLDIINVEDLQTYITTVKSHVKNMDAAKKIGINFSYNLLWDKITSAITNYICAISKINTDIVKNNRLINFKDFEVSHEILQIHAMNLVTLQETFKNIPDYPEKIIINKIEHVIKKILSLYQHIINTKYIEYDYICPPNVLQYLQTIKAYAQSEFDTYCYSFINIVNKYYEKNILEYPNEFNELVIYAIENLKSVRMKETLVTQILISKQESYKPKNTIQHFHYLTQLKKFLKEISKKYNYKQFTPLDILMEVTNGNIILCLGNKHMIDYSIVNNFLSNIGGDKNLIDQNNILITEKKIINACYKKID